MEITKEGPLTAAHNIFEVSLAMATWASVGVGHWFTSALLIYWIDNPAQTLMQVLFANAVWVVLLVLCGVVVLMGSFAWMNHEN